MGIAHVNFLDPASVQLIRPSSLIVAWAAPDSAVDAGLAEIGWYAQIAMEIRFVLRNRLMAEAAPHRRPVEANGGVADGTFLFTLFIRKSTFPTHAECRIFLTFGLQSCLLLCCYFRFLCESLEHSIPIFSAAQRRLQLADLSQSF